MTSFRSDFRGRSGRVAFRYGGQRSRWTRQAVDTFNELDYQEDVAKAALRLDKVPNPVHKTYKDFYAGYVFGITNTLEKYENEEVYSFCDYFYEQAKMYLDGEVLVLGAEKEYDTTACDIGFLMGCYRLTVHDSDKEQSELSRRIEDLYGN